MARTLTDNERHVLAHVVEDPDAWWEHATSWGKIDEEAALAAKVGRHQADHDVECVKDEYKTRAEREVIVRAEEATNIAEAKTASDAKVVADAELFTAKVAEAVATELTKRGV